MQNPGNGKPYACLDSVPGAFEVFPPYSHRLPASKGQAFPLICSDIAL